MATRSDLRSALRQRLEDSSGSPIFADAALNEALTQAMRDYSQRVPKQATASLAIIAGTTTYALPADCRADGIVELLDDAGATVPRRFDNRNGHGPATTADEQAWSSWAGQLRLARTPSSSATWTLHYLATRELVADDVTVQPIEPGHEPIVIALALVWAWDRRSSEDTKRGSKSNAWRQREHAAAEAERLLSAIRRRVRGGWIS